jgi:Bacterial aa3 type cytochrome c oxidase subunit IV
MSGAVEQDYENVSADFKEHLKTYNAFIRFLVICAAATAASLLLLYFFLAR